MKQALYPTVAVITSTIGRPHLEQAIQSVKNQTYPCKHYVFVDGEKFAEDAKAILNKYPDVIVTYLPMNTGADGWTNSSINAIAPFLVKEDIICYLDDDNWYEPNHVEVGVRTLVESQADFAFALRNYYTPDKQFICQDLVESIGHYDNRLPQPYEYYLYIDGQPRLGQDTSHKVNGHIDTNCYVIPRKLAIDVAPFWYSGKINDEHFYQKLKLLGRQSVCTKAFTVNYLVDALKMMPTFFFNIHKIAPGIPDEEISNAFYAILKMKSVDVLTLYGGIYPWD